MTTTGSADPRAAEIQPAVVQRRLAGGEVILIDVREPSEHRAEHIPGAQLIPLSSLDPARVPAAEGKTVVFHCRSGMRSTAALQRLLAAGRTNVASMTGGIDAWKAAGLPTQVDRSAPIDPLRQAQIAIGTIVLTGVALGTLVSPWFLILSGFMGAGLIFAGSTGWCGMAMLMAKMPWNRSAAACAPASPSAAHASA